MHQVVAGAERRLGKTPGVEFAASRADEAVVFQFQYVGALLQVFRGYHRRT